MGTPFFVLSGGLAAWGKGLPSASRLRAGHVPPAPPACGPTPCPPWAAAGPPPAPSSPCRSGRGNVAAKAAPAARPGQVGRQPLRGGTPPQSKAKASRLRRALLCSSPAPVAAQVLRGGPAPKNGGFGPSAPPARSAALRPALPARPRLRRRPCRAALPTHSPPGVAARGPSLGVPPPSRAGAPAAGCCCSPCPCGGPQFRPPRALAAQAPPSPRFARGGAQGNAACGRECRPLRRPARPRQAPRRAASRPQAGALPASAPASDGQTWRVSRPLAGLPPSFHSGV